MNLKSLESIKVWQFAVFALVVSTILYWPSLGGDWLWDDDTSVYDNPLITNPDQFHRIWLSFDDRDYWPLTRSAFWLEYQIFGERPLFYRIVNLLLHVVICTSFLILGRQLKIPGVIWGALLLMLHPVNVATVAWIAELKNLLMVLFLIISAVFFDKYHELSNKKFYCLSLFAFVLALCSKTAGVFFPFILIILLWRRYGEVKVKDIVPIFPFFLASGIMGLLTMYVQYRKDSLIEVMSLPDRIATNGWTLGFYLYKSLIPANLTMIYPNWKDTIESSAVLGFIPVIVFLAIGIFLLVKRNQSWAKSTIILFFPFVFMLLPIMGLFKMAYLPHSLVADWYLYPALPLFCLSLGAVTHFGFRMNQLWIRTVCGLVLLAYLSAFAFTTHSRAAVLNNSEALWRDNTARNPNAWAAYQGLAMALGEGHEDQDEIVELYKKAISLYPNDYLSHQNIAATLGQQYFVLEHSLVEANQRKRMLERSISHEEKEVLEGNINKLVQKKDDAIDGAIKHYRAVLSLVPSYHQSYNDAYGDLVTFLFSCGRKEEAIELLDQLPSQSNHSIVFLRMGEAVLGGRDFHLAEKYLLKALENPNPETLTKAYTLLIRIKIQNEQISKASQITDQLLEYVKAWPSNNEARRWIVREYMSLLQKAQKRTEAKAIADKYSKEFPEVSGPRGNF